MASLLNLRRNACIALSALTLCLVAGVAQAQPTVLKVGTLGGAFEQITQAAARAADREGVIKIVPVVFSSSVLPNEALAGGDIHANQYQHAVFLANELKRRNYKIVRTADIYEVPLAIYSKKHKKLEDLPQGAKFVVPADEANQHRALLALQSNGLIKLKAGFDSAKDGATLLDIAENPRKLSFIEAQVPAIPKLLDDVDGGAVNANTAYQNSGLTLADAIAVESKSEIARYPSVLVVREADKAASWLAALTRAYKSPEVKALAEEKFKGTVVPLF